MLCMCHVFVCHMRSQSYGYISCKLIVGIKPDGIMGGGQWRQVLSMPDGIMGGGQWRQVLSIRPLRLIKAKSPFGKWAITHWLLHVRDVESQLKVHAKCCNCIRRSLLITDQNATNGNPKLATSLKWSKQLASLVIVIKLIKISNYLTLILNIHLWCSNN